MRLVETDLEFRPGDITILEDRGPGRPMRVAGEMQLSDVKNLNGRVYSEDLWKRCLTNEKTKRRLENRQMVGELDHPDSGKTSLRRVSHVMTKLEMKESARPKYKGRKAVYGEYETLPTPEGNILASLLRSNIGLGVSSRGDGDVEERDGAMHVLPESFELETFDVVINPSVDVKVERVSESVDPSSCSCSLPARANESLVSAIAAIVESGVYNEAELETYQEILKSLDESKMDAPIKTRRQLILSLPTKEVPQMKAQESQIQEGVTDNKQLEALRAENATLQKQLQASKALLGEANIQITALKIESKRNEAAARELPVIKKKFEAAKTLMGEMRTTMLGLIDESKKRTKTEKVNQLLVNRIQKEKRESVLSRLLAPHEFDKSTLEALTPILARCETRKEAQDAIVAFANGRKKSRTNESLTEANPGVRKATVVESPLIDATDPNKQKNGKPQTKFVSEAQKSQVDFSRRLVANTR